MPDDFAEWVSSTSRWTEPWAGVPYKLPFGPGNEDDSLEVDCGAMDAELLDATSARRSSSFPTTLTGIAVCFFSAVTSDADTADDDSVSGADESCGDEEDAMAVGTNRIRLITCLWTGMYFRVNNLDQMSCPRGSVPVTGTRLDPLGSMAMCTATCTSSA